MNNKNVISIILVVFLIILSNATYSQKGESPIHISEWVKGKETNLNNKTIIIEFWATWCKPCVGAISHINELSKKNSSDSVVFISMTSYDTKEKVEAFLQKHNFKTYVVIDDNKKTYKKLNINSIPTTLIINPQKEVVWKGDPGQLTSQNLQLYLSKKTIPTVDIQNPEFFSFNISYAYDRDISKTSYTGGNPEKVDFINKDLESIIRQIFIFYGKFSSYGKNIEYKFIGTLPIEPKVNFNYTIDTTYSKKARLFTLMNNLALIYNFKVDTVWEEKQVYNMLLPTNYDNIDTSSYSYKKVGGEHKFERIDLYKLERNLFNEFKINLLIKGDKSRKVNCSIYENDLEKTIKSLKESGIKLTPKKINIPVWSFTFN
ncbi:MAG: hypothetical protein COA97_08950 [Flavobacteriales bacterium]|nr:MAG: hypothetical protein COA97_08950 [Flavobacteriales bacterium]